ncbi:hypothetical protein COCON_G00160830 [Conger conger]|uniref:Uncharacterized protein n=1 Tax=Conger conger TaxID=82655 RepID=A0A9Q1DA42_CONCO|nr:hypothetical protein COCON_G00160830 [Conger conger]
MSSLCSSCPAPRLVPLQREGATLPGLPRGMLGDRAALALVRWLRSLLTPRFCHRLFLRASVRLWGSPAPVPDLKTLRPCAGHLDQNFLVNPPCLIGGARKLGVQLLQTAPEFRRPDPPTPSPVA